MNAKQPSDRRFKPGEFDPIAIYRLFGAYRRLCRPRPLIKTSFALACGWLAMTIATCLGLGRPDYAIGFAVIGSSTLFMYFNA